MDEKDQRAFGLTDDEWLFYGDHFPLLIFGDRKGEHKHHASFRRTARNKCFQLLRDLNVAIRLNEALHKELKLKPTARTTYSIINNTRDVEGTFPWDDCYVAPRRERRRQGPRHNPQIDDALKEWLVDVADDADHVHDAFNDNAFNDDAFGDVAHQPVSDAVCRIKTADNPYGTTVKKISAEYLANKDLLHECLNVSMSLTAANDANRVLLNHYVVA